MQPWEEEKVEVGPNGETIVSNAVMTNDEMAEWHAVRRDQLPWQVMLRVFSFS
jgi:hypothetical protein